MNLISGFTTPLDGIVHAMGEQYEPWQILMAVTLVQAIVIMTAALAIVVVLRWARR